MDSLPWKLGEYVEFANQTYVENSEESVICTAEPEQAKLIVESVNRVKQLEEAFSSLYYSADKLCRRADDSRELPRCITDLTRPLSEYKPLMEGIEQALKQGVGDEVVI